MPPIPGPDVCLRLHRQGPWAVQPTRVPRHNMGAQGCRSFPPVRSVARPLPQRLPSVEQKKIRALIRHGPPLRNLTLQGLYLERRCLSLPVPAHPNQRPPHPIPLSPVRASVQNPRFSPRRCLPAVIPPSKIGPGRKLSGRKEAKEFFTPDSGISPSSMTTASVGTLRFRRLMSLTNVGQRLPFIRRQSMGVSGTLGRPAAVGHFVSPSGMASGLTATSGIGPAGVSPPILQTQPWKTVFRSSWKGKDPSVQDVKYRMPVLGGHGFQKPGGQAMAKKAAAVSKTIGLSSSRTNGFTAGGPVADPGEGHLILRAVRESSSPGESVAGTNAKGFDGQVHQITGPTFVAWQRKRARICADIEPEASDNFRHIIGDGFPFRPTSGLMNRLVPPCR